MTEKYTIFMGYFLIRDKFIPLVVIRLLSCYYICPLLICLIDPRDVLTIVNNHGVSVVKCYIKNFILIRSIGDIDWKNL